MVRRIFLFRFMNFYKSIDDCDELPKCDCNDLNVDLIILN